MEDWVYMTHPDIPLAEGMAPAYVTREAYDEVWAEKGWLVSDYTPPAEEAPVATEQPVTEEVL